MSIVDKLTYLNTTKQLLKTEINKINNVLDDNSTFRSYPQELFNGYLDILNNGTDTLWNNLEKVSASGEEATLENVETAPIKMVLNGNTSQDGTPTPDTPVEVKVVKGENVVSVSGKNLFDKDNQAIVQVNAEGTLRYGIIVDAPNKKVSISAKTWGQAVAYKTLIGGVYGQYSTIQRNSTFEIEEKIIIYNSKSEVQPLDLDIEDLQIEISDVPTDYVPYSKTDYPISLGTIEMCKIGNYQDFFFQAINGDLYYDTLTEEQKNALVYGKWYVHKEINKKLLKPTSATLEENGIRARYNIDAPIKSYPTAYCNYFGIATAYDRAVNTNGNYPNLLNVNATGALLCNIAGYTTTNQYINFFNDNDVYFYYPLATPTETEITNTTLIEQLEAISKAKSVKDKTYVTQTNDELPFILDVEAIKEYSVE